MKRLTLCLSLLCLALPALADEKRCMGLAIQHCAGGYSWVLQRFADGDELLLWQNGQQIGNYVLKEQQYYAYVDGRRWKVSEPPVALPPGYKLTKNYGVTWTPREKDENVLHFGGGNAPDVKKIIKKTSDASEVPNYNGMWSVTVVSADADRRKQVMDDFQNHPALVRWKTERLKEYDPGHPTMRPFKLVEDTGFQESGLVTLVSPPCDGNFKAPVEAIYGYAGPEDHQSRLRDIESKYNPNVHSGGQSAGVSKGQAAAISGVTVGIVLTVLLGGALVAVVLWYRRAPAPIEAEEEKS